MAVTLFTILLALGLSTVTATAGFLLWWFFDQRKSWVTVLLPNGSTDQFKTSLEGDQLRIDRYEEAVEIPLEEEKQFYKLGWRSGPHIFVDLTDGVQVDPRVEAEHRVGYDMATVIDTKWGERWRAGFPDDKGLGEALAEFLNNWGWLFVVLSFLAFVVYIIKAV